MTITTRDIRKTINDLNLNLDPETYEDAVDYALRLVETVEDLEITLMAAQMLCRLPHGTSASSAGVKAAMAILDDAK